jgi:hypothetical protein
MTSRTESLIAALCRAYPQLRVPLAELADVVAEECAERAQDMVAEMRVRAPNLFDRN